MVKNFLTMLPMKKSCLLSVFSLGLSLAGPLAATTITIDNFEDSFAAETFYDISGSSSVLSGLEVGAIGYNPGNLNQLIVRETETQTQSGLAGVLGGERTASLTRTAPIGSTSFSRVGSATSGVFDWTHINGTRTRTVASLQYGAGTALNADFSTLGGGAYFFLGGWSLDQGSVDATVSVTSGTTTQSVTLSLAAANPLSPLDYSIAFSAFTLINFSDVDLIELAFENTSDSQDSALQLFSVEGAVPVSDESASPLLLLGMTLAGLMVRGRMRPDSKPRKLLRSLC